jgi:hypothetical protein
MDNTPEGEAVDLERPGIVLWILRKLDDPRVLTALAFLTISQGFEMLKSSLDLRFQVNERREEGLRELHADTRTRVFAIETLLEAEGILKAEPPAVDKTDDEIYFEDLASRTQELTIEEAKAYAKWKADRDAAAADLEKGTDSPGTQT